MRHLYFIANYIKLPEVTDPSDPLFGLQFSTILRHAVGSGDH
jgi:hypothetical protein